MPSLGDLKKDADLPGEEDLSDDFGTIPEGWYAAKVNDTSIEETNDSKGTDEFDAYYLKLEYEIQGPSYEGRKAWKQITLQNPSEKAEEIGDEELVKLRLALGMAETPEDEKRYIGKVCQIKIKHEEYKGETQERVKGFRANDQPADGPFDDGGSGDEESDFGDDDIPF